MEHVVILALMYLAIGAAFFAHPRDGGEMNDFHWRGQIAVFRETLPAVLAWPLVAWRRYRAR